MEVSSDVATHMTSWSCWEEFTLQKPSEPISPHCHVFEIVFLPACAFPRWAHMTSRNTARKRKTNAIQVWTFRNTLFQRLSAGQYTNMGIIQCVEWDSNLDINQTRSGPKNASASNTIHRTWRLAGFLGITRFKRRAKFLPQTQINYLLQIN